MSRYATIVAEHPGPQAKMGRPLRPGEAVQVVGHFSDVEAGREAMGIGWMARDELAEAIPPAYTEFIGRQLLEHIAQESRRNGEDPQTTEGKRASSVGY